MENSADPDKKPHSTVSHLSLHCLLRHVCLNTYGNYGTLGKGSDLKRKNLVLREAFYFFVFFSEGSKTIFDRGISLESILNP